MYDNNLLLISNAFTCLNITLLYSNTVLLTTPHVAVRRHH